MLVSRSDIEDAARLHGLSLKDTFLGVVVDYKAADFPAAIVFEEAGDGLYEVSDVIVSIKVSERDIYDVGRVLAELRDISETLDRFSRFLGLLRNRSKYGSRYSYVLGYKFIEEV